MSIDHRHVYGIMLDTETANTLEIIGEDKDGNPTKKLDMSSVLVYDLGFAIIDSHGTVYETFSFIVSDIFDHETDLMQSAYYAKKIPQYVADLEDGTRQKATAYDVRQTLLAKIAEYNCEFVCAHNMRFDLNACNNLIRWTTKSKFRYFFPYGVEIWDTMRMANEVICKMPTYRQFCEENGYITKNNQCRKTAEVLYRFITGDNEFEESHTGLEDVLIEAEILRYCVRQHKTMRKTLFNEQTERPKPTEFQMGIMKSLRECPMLHL